MPFRLEECNNCGSNPARSSQGGGDVLMHTINAEDGGVWPTQADDKRFTINVNAVVFIGHTSSQWLDRDALGVPPSWDARQNLVQWV
jgi:hypothetical protein